MDPRRLVALIQKELLQLLRDRTTLILVMAIPVVELFLFAYAVELTVDHIPAAVADMSLDSQSAIIIDALAKSNYFDITLPLEDEEAVVRAIDQGKVRAGFVIPPDFANQIERDQAQLLVILDGSDSFTIQSGYGAAVAITQKRALSILTSDLERLGLQTRTLPITASTQVLYNPTMDDMIFILPAMVGILLQLLTVNLTAMAVARERELGTIEQILITPARPVELMIAKTVPNIIVSAVGMTGVTLLGIFFFGVPFHGDPWLFTGLSLLYLLSGLGLGLLISTVSQSQKQAQQVSMLLTLLSLLLTGFIYPLEPMPPAVRAVSNLIPLTFFVRIIRGIFTRGVGLEFLWSDVVALTFYATLAMILAAASFRKRLD